MVVEPENLTTTFHKRETINDKQKNKMVVEPKLLGTIFHKR